MDKEICFFYPKLKRFNCCRFECVYHVQGSKSIFEGISIEERKYKGITIGEGYFPIYDKKIESSPWTIVKLVFE